MFAIKFTKTAESFVLNSGGTKVPLLPHIKIGDSWYGRICPSVKEAILSSPLCPSATEAYRIDYFLNYDNPAMKMEVVAVEIGATVRL